MLVIHPKDRTTEFLSVLYDGEDNAVVIAENISRADLNHKLHHISKSERIFLLGHGSDKGLFWREDDSKLDFDWILVGHPHTYYLRNHGSNIVAVFCNADKFAVEEHLHGLFTGMMISELSEAIEFGIETTKEELANENLKFIKRLRSLLDDNVPLCEVPQKMLEFDDRHTPLTEFNYKRIYFL